MGKITFELQVCLDNAFALLGILLWWPSRGWAYGREHV